jgi:hypothetical protein
MKQCYQQANGPNLTMPLGEKYYVVLLSREIKLPESIPDEF